jgi:hypothetical protein
MKKNNAPMISYQSAWGPRMTGVCIDVFIRQAPQEYTTFDSKQTLFATAE